MMLNGSGAGPKGQGEVMLDRRKGSRLHLRSIRELASRQDAPPPDGEIAELFREMRQTTGLSLQETARELQTQPATIELLEQGRLSLLPPWDETSRIIGSYTKMLGLDADPVMRRVMLQLPRDHPRRPRTSRVNPSYNNMQANADAVMNRIPAGQRAVEAQSVPIGEPVTRLPAMPSRHDDNRSSGNFAPGFAEMRAIPPAYGSGGFRDMPPLAEPRKRGFLVAFVQFLLFLIILAAGYAIWLAVNDPQGYEELKRLILTKADEWQRQVLIYVQNLFN